MTLGDPYVVLLAAMQQQLTAAQAAAAVQSDWASVNNASPAYIANKPPARSQLASTRAFNTPYQISTTQDSSAGYSVTIACTLSLTTGQSGSVILEYADDNLITTNVMTAGIVTNGNTGSLTIGLNLVQTLTLRLVGFIPAGKWARLRTVNNTGTPSFTFVNGNELLM